MGQPPRVVFATACPELVEGKNLHLCARIRTCPPVELGLLRTCGPRRSQRKVPPTTDALLMSRRVVISRPLCYNRGAEQPRWALVHRCPAFLRRERPSNSQMPNPGSSSCRGPRSEPDQEKKKNAGKQSTEPEPGGANLGWCSRRSP